MPERASCSVDGHGSVTIDELWDYFIDRGYAEDDVEALTRELGVVDEAEQLDRAEVVAALSAAFDVLRPERHPNA